MALSLLRSYHLLIVSTNRAIAIGEHGKCADLTQVPTPVIVLYEVYRWLRRERGDEEALIAAAQIAKTQVVPVTVTLALTAADLGLEHGLPMADSLVYATAMSTGAELITSDADFASLPGVIYLAKPKPGPPTPG